MSTFTASSDHRPDELRSAAKRGDLAIIQNLVTEATIDLNASTAWGATALHYASEYGRTSVIHFLINHQPSAQVNVKEDRGWTPLHLACRWGHGDAAQILLENGANIHEETKLGETPLDVAVSAGDLQVLDVLLNHGVRMDQVNNERAETPLFTAVRHGHVAMARALLEKGALVDFRNHDGDSPLLVACSLGIPTQVIQLLLDHGARADQRDSRGRTALHRVIEELASLSFSTAGHLRCVEKLLVAGALANAQDFKGDSPLHTCYRVKSAHWSPRRLCEMTRLLIQYGALVTTRNRSGFTPLELALHITTPPHQQEAPGEEGCELRSSLDGVFILVKALWVN